MGPTQNGSEPLPGSASQPSLFDQLGHAPEKRKEVQPGLSAEPNVPLPVEPLNGTNLPSQGPVLVPTRDASAEPVWVRRLKLVVYVLFCIELGMLLAVLPWTRVWSDNSFLLAHAGVRDFLHQDFIRGAVTGLGLVDIWLGIREAVNYRENR